MLRFLVFGVIASVAFGQCPDMWVSHGDSCYYLVATELDWFSADKYCSLYDPTSYKVHLVSIETPQEQEFLADYARRNGVPGMSYWTSGNTLDSRQGWVWASSTNPFNFFSWAIGEPSGNGMCVQMWSDRGYNWDDTPCENFDIGALCEVAFEDVPKIKRFN